MQSSVYFWPGCIYCILSAYFAYSYNMCIRIVAIHSSHTSPDDLREAITSHKITKIHFKPTEQGVEVYKKGQPSRRGQPPIENKGHSPKVSLFRGFTVCIPSSPSSWSGDLSDGVWGRCGSECVVVETSLPQWHPYWVCGVCGGLWRRHCH